MAAGVFELNRSLRQLFKGMAGAFDLFPEQSLASGGLDEGLEPLFDDQTVGRLLCPR